MISTSVANVASDKYVILFQRTYAVHDNKYN